LTMMFSYCFHKLKCIRVKTILPKVHSLRLYTVVLIFIIFMNKNCKTPSIRT
jgi:hypothetical protein